MKKSIAGEILTGSAKESGKRATSKVSLSKRQCENGGINLEALINAFEDARRDTKVSVHYKGDEYFLIKSSIVG